MTSWRIIPGDCRQALASLPDESVQCCITSPPYFGLRDYGVDGQIGLEESPEAWLDEMVAVFREVRRVLRSDGTLWLNLGDAYNTRQRGSDNGWDKSRLTNPARVQKAQAAALRPRRAYEGSKPKDLLGLPWMVAFALRADGRWLREDVIWHKLTPMPESVGDRCTRAHEYCFRLTKSARYFADQDAIREPLKPKTLTTFGTTREQNGAGEHVKADNWARDVPERQPRVGFDGEPVGANKRSVWPIASSPFPEAHFATFPPALVEPMVLSATSPHACAECSAPWRRVTERIRERLSAGECVNGWGDRSEGRRGPSGDGHRNAYKTDVHTLGFEPTCDHDAPGGASLVLDPFAGAGTTGLVALRHGRSFIGIELNPEYVEMARRRIIDDAPLLNQWAEDAA